MNAPSTAVGVCAAIRERRSLRAFSQDPVSSDLLMNIFEAARWAPSSGNSQPWRFVLTRRHGPGFNALAATVWSSNRWAVRAPVLVLAAVRTHHFHRTKPPRVNRLALLELGLAIGNLLTQSTAVGLVAHPLAGFDYPAAGDELRIPDGYYPALIVAIGFPGEVSQLDPGFRAKDERPRERLDLHEIVFSEVWNEKVNFEREFNDGTVGSAVEAPRSDAGVEPGARGSQNQLEADVE